MFLNKRSYTPIRLSHQAASNYTHLQIVKLKHQNITFLNIEIFGSTTNKF